MERRPLRPPVVTSVAMLAVRSKRVSSPFSARSPGNPLADIPARTRTKATIDNAIIALIKMRLPAAIPTKAGQTRSPAANPIHGPRLRVKMTAVSWSATSAAQPA